MGRASGRSNLNIGRGALGDGFGEELVEGLDLGASHRRWIFAEEDGREVDFGYGELWCGHLRKLGARCRAEAGARA